MKRSFALIAPYAAWMALMAVLPQTAWAYALRGLVTAALLAAGAIFSRDRNVASPPVAATAERCDGKRGRDIFVACLSGLSVGLLVFFVWIAPEPWLWPAGSTSDHGVPSPYAPESCGMFLTLAKLAASAFVISVAEELFFRQWRVGCAGFGWMLALFGGGRMRWGLGAGRGCVFIAEGVFAGLAYGLLAKRFGILSAIVAHAATNFILGIYVIVWDKWFYW